MNKSSILYRLLEVLGKIIIYLFGRLIELLTGKIVFDNPYKYEGLKMLEQHYEVVLSELLFVLENRIVPGIDEYFMEQTKLASNNSWKSFPLFIYGYEFTDNTNLCPRTKELLMDVKGMSSAMFSVLSASKIIPPHTGPYKGVLRVHLGLIIPEKSNKKCYIEVDNQIRYWEKGKLMVFDDTHNHAAYNYTNSDRIVLFIDIIRPLPFPIYLINKALFSLISNSPFITGTKENYKRFGNSNFLKHRIKFSK